MATHPDLSRAHRLPRSIYVDPSVKPFERAPLDVEQLRRDFEADLAADEKVREALRRSNAAFARTMVAVGVLLILYVAIGMLIAHARGVL